MMCMIWDILRIRSIAVSLAVGGAGALAAFLIFRGSPLLLALTPIALLLILLAILRRPSARIANCLTRKVSVEEVEAQHMHAGVPFGPGRRNQRWNELKSEMHEGDELWEFSTPEWTWLELHGRAGLVVVRNGKPTRHILITRMN